jgi:hypothetical protein
MKTAYRRWLEQRGRAGTVNAQMFRGTRVEDYHGNP